MLSDEGQNAILEAVLPLDPGETSGGRLWLQTLAFFLVSLSLAGFHCNHRPEEHNKWLCFYAKITTGMLVFDQLPIRTLPASPLMHQGKSELSTKNSTSSIVQRNFESNLRTSSV